MTADADSDLDSDSDSDFEAKSVESNNDKESETPSKPAATKDLVDVQASFTSLSLQTPEKVKDPTTKAQSHPQTAIVKMDRGSPCKFFLVIRRRIIPSLTML